MIILDCKICCNEFYARLSKVNKRKTCSRECQYKYYSINYSGKNSPSWKGMKIKKICLQCGGIFFCQSSKSRPGKLCSKECRIEWSKRNQIEKNCLNCNKKFIVKLYKKDSSKFCCRKCTDKWKSINLRGSNSHAWNGGCTPERQEFYNTSEWKEISQQVWKRDNATCQRCNNSWKTVKKFHIHHIVSFAVKELRAKIDNLVLLCEDCHMWIHSKKNINKEFIKEIDNE